MLRSIIRFLKIYPDERGGFIRLALLFFCFYFLLGLFRIYVEASFLKRYGPSHIPWMLLFNGVLSFFFFNFCRHLSGRFSDKTLLAGFTLLFGLVQWGLFWGIRGGGNFAYPILFQILYLKDAFLLVYLWNLTQKEFDARQGKRLFRLFMAAQVLGNTLGSLAANPLAQAMGQDFILALASGAELILPLLVVFLASGRDKTSEPTDPEKLKIDARGLFQALKGYPIFRFLCVCALIPNILLPILTYQFGAVVEAAFPSEQALLIFLSWFRAGTPFFIFVFLLSLGPLYSKLSPRTAAVITPLNQCLVFGSLAGFFNIVAVAYGQFSVIFFQRAILGPITKQLSNLLPENIISWAQFFVKGLLSQVGMLVGALLMLVLKPLISPRAMAWPAFLLAFYWSIEAFFFRQRYREGLKQIILHEGLDYDRFSELAAGQENRPSISHPTVDIETYPEDLLTLMEELDLPWIEPEEALEQLDSPDETLRSQAALSFSLSRDFRAVNKLIDLLEDVDSVRKAAKESLSRYGSEVLPILEEALLECSIDSQRQILEILRLTQWPGWDANPFLEKKIILVYEGLIAAGTVETLAENEAAFLLVARLREKIQEDIHLIFLTLGISHADMRLVYWGVNSMQSSAAVELLETSLDPTTRAWLVPLIDSLPEKEKIEWGRKLLPLRQVVAPDRMLALLTGTQDPLTRLLALYAVGQLLPSPAFYPLAERRLADPDPEVRQAALYCLNRCSNQEGEMPEIIRLVQYLRDLEIFKGMGIRELRAVASITQEKSYPTGSTVMGLKKFPEGLYLLTDGRIVQRNREGKDLAMFGKGSFFGELDLFVSPEKCDEYVVLEEAKTLVIPREHFIEIIKLHPLVGLNLCRFFAARLHKN